MTYRILLFMLFVLPLQAQNLTQAKIDSMDALRISYIAQYKNLAILEMYKSGIPASITLAQGILETASGTSELCRNANNHFGMKCGSGWLGAQYYKHDDEYDAQGNKQKSCFRSYISPGGNFSDHSDFLRDPVKFNRYGKLFDLDPLDYYAWATGLQASGYSTVGHYSARLIEYIERYKLHQLDYAVWNNLYAAEPNQRITFVNGVRMVRALQGETPSLIASSCGINLNSVLIYNENQYNYDTPLEFGTHIYIDAKKNSWTQTDHEIYYAEDGLSLFQIGQLYGINSSAIRTMNNIPYGAEPADKAKVRIQGIQKEGEKMAVTYKSLKEKSLKVRNKNAPQPPQVFAFPVNTTNQRWLDSALTPIRFNVISSAASPKTNQHTDDNIKPVLDLSGNFYTVGKGDTLMAISRKFGLDVNALRQLNGIQGDGLQIGQKIRVK